MRLHPYRLLIFDWDGTLADSTSIIASALRSACHDIGHAVPAEDVARHVIGLGLMDALSYAAPTLEPHRYAELSQRFRHHYLAREADIALFEGARELLEALAAESYLVAIATGKTRAGLDRSLAQHQLHSAFHATRCADEARPKPAPDMVLQLMERVGTTREETMMIGDTTHDLEMARNAGIDAIAVTHGAHADDELRAASPRFVVSALGELRRILVEG